MHFSTKLAKGLEIVKKVNKIGYIRGNLLNCFIPYIKLLLPNLSKLFYFSNGCAVLANTKNLFF